MQSYGNPYNFIYYMVPVPVLSITDIYRSIRPRNCHEFQNGGLFRFLQWRIIIRKSSNVIGFVEFKLLLNKIMRKSLAQVICTLQDVLGNDYWGVYRVTRGGVNLAVNSRR